MDKFYVVAGAIVIAAVIWRGASTHPSEPGEGRTIELGRGHVQAGSVAHNLHSSQVEGTSSETARGAYPPRALGLTAQRMPPSNSWLLDADSDRDRFQRIEAAMRGLDVTMFEIGARFGTLHDAIERGNFGLAQHEAARIGEAARVGMLKRPGFRHGEGVDYLGAVEWTALTRALQARDIQRSRAAFLDVRRSCTACHATQNMGYLNESDVFDRTAQFSTAPTSASDRPAR
jgi:hypothetical protein